MSASRSLSFSVLRSFHATPILSKGNKPRLKVRSGLGTGSSAGSSRREWVTQLRASAMRQRWEAEEESIAKRKCFHPPPGLSVFFSPNFETPSWPLISAVAMLRESAVPEMYCCENNPLYAKIRLNLRTKKANKFISKVETSVTPPHQLDFLPKRRIIVLTNNPAVAEKCTELGAVAAGGADVIGRLEVGGFHWEEYDDVVAHTDFANSLNKIRKILQNRMPSVKNGRMGEDVVGLIKAQQDCVLVNSTPVEGVPEINDVQVVLGQLSWDEVVMEENLACYLNAIYKAKSSRVNGEFIERVELLCPPCDEVFHVNFRDLLEDPTQGQSESMDSFEEEDF
ncbi:hypothetical protein Aperf_G00000110267 [Anoplocephala perfoliata]